MSDEPDDVLARDDRPWEDPIVAEIHAIRERLFEEAGGDLDRLYAMLKASEASRGITFVSRPPKPPHASWAAAPKRPGEAA